MDYSQGTRPDEAYEAWKANWKPPQVRPKALPGKVIVEFAPFGNRGDLWRPEQASNNAIVVCDGYEFQAHREGYLPMGTEIIYTGTDGVGFAYEDRTLFVLPKKDVEMMVENQRRAAA